MEERAAALRSCRIRQQLPASISVFMWRVCLLYMCVCVRVHSAFHLRQMVVCLHVLVCGVPI